MLRASRVRRFAAAASLGAVLALAAGALAAPEDDRALTTSLLKEVDASPRKAIAAEMVGRAHAASERAARLRSSGDEARARLADGLARAWAESARDVVRAAEVETRAYETRRAATDAGVMAERERALLEEGTAQSGRLRAQLEAVEREAKEQPARTSAAANAPSDAGAPKARPRDGRGGKEGAGAGAAKDGAGAGAARDGAGAGAARDGAKDGAGAAKDGGAR